MFNRLIISLILILSTSSSAFAFHPLMTDQAYTTGQGFYLLDINSSYSTKYGDIEFSPELSYGVINDLDIMVGFGSDINQSLGMSLDLKLILLKNNYLVISIKPFAGLKILSLSGNTYDLGLIVVGSLNLGQYIIHENFGYDFINKAIFISGAGEYIITNDLALTLDIGTKGLVSGDIFGIVGLIYAVSEDIDIDLGVKYELSDNDISGLLGLAVKF